MTEYSSIFKDLVSTYLQASIEFPALRPITVAQWTVESGYGTSRLATEHLNFAGLKWRSEMSGFATAVVYSASDGSDEYCKFDTLSAFIKGYWRFLDRAPYAGWRAHAGSASDFIHFIGPIYTPTKLYAETVLSLQPKAESLLASLDEGGDTGQNKPPGTHEPSPKPVIDRFIRSPNQSSRNGERIRRIIVHCTTSRNLDGTIAHFLNPNSQVSAHYVIGRDGTIVQMVHDADKAWHARNANADSIGIEHSGNATDTLTAEQRDSSVALIRWLLAEYKLTTASIHGHQFTPENKNHTTCPDMLFGADTEAAVAGWVADNVGAG